MMDLLHVTHQYDSLPFSRWRGLKRALTLWGKYWNALAQMKWGEQEGDTLDFFRLIAMKPAQR